MTMKPNISDNEKNHFVENDQWQMSTSKSIFKSCPSYARKSVSIWTVAISSTSSNMDLYLFVEEENRSVRIVNDAVNVNRTECIVSNFLCRTLFQVSEKMSVKMSNGCN